MSMSKQTLSSAPQSRFLATPKLNNKIDSKIFDTAKEAKKYLDEYTELPMPIQDWIMVGKITEVSDAL